MVDKIKDFDTSIIIAMIVTGVVILSIMGEVKSETLMFFTNVVAYILGVKHAKI